MIKEQLYDSFCTNANCLSRKHSFFKFDPEKNENVHLSENHDIKTIGNATFYSFIQAQKAKTQIHKQMLAQITKVIDNAIEEITVSLKKVFNKYLESTQKIKGQMFDDISQFTRGMKEGNYTYLSNFLKFQTDQQNIFKDHQRILGDNLKHMITSVEKHKYELISFTQLYSAVTLNFDDNVKLDNKLVDSTFLFLVSFIDRVNNLSQDMKVQQNSMKRQKEGERKITEMNEQREDLEKIEEMEEEVSSIFELSNENDKKSSKRMKSKIISKCYEVKSRKKKKIIARDEINFQENITLIAPFEVKLDNIIRDNRVVSYISQQFPKMKALHLFSNKINVNLLVSIIQGFPTLEELSFNCPISIHLLRGLQASILKKLKKIYFCWNIQKFHQQFMIQEYFGDRSLKEDSQKEMTPRLKIALEEKLRELFQNEHFDMLHQNTLYQDFSNVKRNINSMHLPLEKIIKTLCSITSSLQFLRIQATGKDEQESQYSKFRDYVLAEFIEKNQNIKCIFLDNIFNCSSDLEQIDSSEVFINAFEQLLRLPQLTTFLWICQKQTLVSENRMSRFRHLAHLYLDNLKFDSNMPLSFLKQVGQLRSLSLYRCQDITSNHINQLQQQSVANMEFLNLGYTRVDQTCLKTIAKMENLYFLNLQNLMIKGDHLIRMSQNYFSLFHKKHPLKRLNISMPENWKNRTVQNLIRRYQHGLTFQMSTKDSIQNLNQEYKIQKEYSFEDKLWNEYIVDEKQKSSWSDLKRDRQTVNLLTQQNFDLLAEFFPELIFLNLRNHFNFLDVKFSKKLKYLIKDEWIQRWLKVESAEKVYVIFKKWNKLPQK